jgi:hypothetical protein
MRLFGKQQNPMQTMIGGMAKLSMVTRRNLFYRDVIKKNEEVIKTGWQLQIKDLWHNLCLLDQKKKLEHFLVMQTLEKYNLLTRHKDFKYQYKAGATTPFGQVDNTFYARNGVADAIEGTSFVKGDRGPVGRLYDSLVLYPKAASQIAKTILSPVTHLRNFVSAGAFAAANGIIPAADPAAIKQAYQALQTGLKGTRQQNDLYQELLELGVVNSNVRLGDLSKLWKTLTLVQQ